MTPDIKSQVAAYFQYKHGAFVYTRGWLRVPVCPFCGAEEKYGVHPGTNRTHCFRCEYATQPLYAIMEIEDFKSMTEVFNLLAELKDKGFRLPKYEPIPQVPVILPKGFTSIRRGDSLTAKQARKYMQEERGIPLDILTRANVGYVSDPESELHDYIIFPFKRSGKVIYYQTRAFRGDGPKFKNPKYEDFGVGKSQVIYNGDILSGTNYFKYAVGIVESAINALTLDLEAVGLSGKAFSQRQLQDLISSHVNGYFIFLDHDAIKYAFKLAYQLIRYKLLKVVIPPPGEDVNSLGNKEAFDLVGQAPILTSMKDLTKYKNEMFRLWNI